MRRPEPGHRPTGKVLTCVMRVCGARSDPDVTLSPERLAPERVIGTMHRPQPPMLLCGCIKDWYI